MRKLASIQKIESLEPIPNADLIERAKILGWYLVVKKGQFKVGDKAVYCEIDSLLPEKPEFEFLRKSCFKPGLGFRIKTIKLKKQISQGIAFPLDILPEGTSTEIGTDVSEVLNIQKYEPPLPASFGGKLRGLFPDKWFPKTDETRVQVLESVLQRHQGKTFYITEKLDGTSCTVFITKDDQGVCSRNYWIDESDEQNTLCKVIKDLDLINKLRELQNKYGKYYVIQGELIGQGIQKNKYDLKGYGFYPFNVLAFNNDCTYASLVSHEENLKVVKELGLEPVPQLGTIVLNHSVDDLINLSEGKSVLNSKAHREGIVLRPLVDETDPELGRLSFKAINPHFLLKYDE